MRLADSLFVLLSFAVAALFVYDAKRALRPRIPGEQPWRRRRVAGTALSVLAIAVVQRSAEVPWRWWTALAGLTLALAFVLRCSVPLSRFVAARLLQPKDS